MKNAVFTIASCIVCCAHAHADIGQDKYMHMAGTALISGAVTLAAQDSQNRFWYGFGAGMAVGIAKELADRRQGCSGFSSRDLAADAIGSALGAWMADSALKLTVRSGSGGKPVVGVAYQIKLE